MRKAFILLLACTVLLSTTATSQTRRRGAPNRSAPASRKAAEKSALALKAGRARVATQIKSLTHFLYLYGVIAKGIESSDQAVLNREASPATAEQNERNKTKVRASIRDLRIGFDKLETDFHFNPALKAYYPRVAGVARLAEAAENQAAANRFNEVGRLLLQAVDQLADALAAMG